MEIFIQMLKGKKLLVFTQQDILINCKVKTVQYNDRNYFCPAGFGFDCIFFYSFNPEVNFTIFLSFFSAFLEKYLLMNS